MQRAVQRDLAFQEICEIKQYESHISRKCGLINPNKINETKVAQRNAILKFFSPLEIERKSEKYAHAC